MIENKPKRIRIPLCMNRDFMHNWPGNCMFYCEGSPLVLNVAPPVGRKRKDGYKPNGYMQSYILKEACLRVYAYDNIPYEVEEEWDMFNRIWDYLDSFSVDEIINLSYDEIIEKFYATIKKVA